MSDLIGEYAAHLERQRYTEATVEHYIKLLRRADREVPAGLAAAPTEELEGWIFQPGRAETTYANYVTTVSGFCRWAIGAPRLGGPEDPRLDFNAAALLPQVRADSEAEAEPVTEEEFADILSLAGDPYKDLFILAGYEGHRCIEIARSHREHLT